jgi:magnesium transporter
LSEIADEDVQPSQEQRSRRGRRRRDRWPDLSVLEDWTIFEKEIIDRNEERRIKKITEPQLINGRLRPTQKGWFKAEEDAPYRFTYFNEELQSTIHSQTISELVQPDSSFRELFIPDPPILPDSSSESDEEGPQPSRLSARGSVRGSVRGSEGGNGSKVATRQLSLAMANKSPEDYGTGNSRPLSPRQLPTGSNNTSRHQSGEATPVGTGIRSPPTVVDIKSPEPFPQKPVRFGDRPVWWLDVLSPTADEMKVIQKTFGIHPLTSEDIMLQEQREKVELFRHYYFVSYRSFDQDEESEKHLDPVNIYVVVFREGIISFHFEHTPHPANVRRRIRQLQDYIMLSADWISYAIIDDITDVFGPLVQHIQEEVDDIEDAILSLNVQSQAQMKRRKDETDGEKSLSPSGVPDQDDGDMLHRIGQCRKKATELLRLLGNKADVIKGFAKRCNEHYEVAPRSEIGLYLGDIQDHIITMTGNLMHADK